MHNKINNKFSTEFNEEAIFLSLLCFMIFTIDLFLLFSIRLTARLYI